MRTPYEIFLALKIDGERRYAAWFNEQINQFFNEHQDIEKLSLNEIQDRFFKWLDEKFPPLVN